MAQLWLSQTPTTIIIPSCAIATSSVCNYKSTLPAVIIAPSRPLNEFANCRWHLHLVFFILKETEADICFQNIV